MALPLIPPQRVDAVYQAIAAGAPNVPQAPQFDHYMMHTYVGNGALFPKAIWNLFNSVDRTTNMCEGFHSKLNKRMGHHTPSVFKIIEFIQDTGKKYWTAATRCSS